MPNVTALPSAATNDPWTQRGRIGRWCPRLAGQEGVAVAGAGQGPGDTAEPGGLLGIPW